MKILEIEKCYQCKHRLGLLSDTFCTYYRDRDKWKQIEDSNFIPSWCPLPAAEGENFQRTVGEWGDEVFTESTQDSIGAHLKREVSELSEEHKPSEGADCFILLLHHAHKGGYDLLDEARKKFKINKKRKWGKPDAEGVVEHLDR